jgi:Family of unknown function (DUF7019)
MRCFMVMTDAVKAFGSEYVYVSDRLINDIVDQLAAAEGRLGVGNMQFKLPFFALESRYRDLGINRYAQAGRATEAVADLTGSFEVPGPFVRGRAQMSWWELKVTEHPVVRVAWLVARQAGDHGSFLLSMCGSLEHYIGYQPGADTAAGWRPSALPGLANVLKAFNHRSGRKYKVDPNPPNDQEAVRTMLLEAAHVGMFLDEEKHAPIGVGQMEVLARVYYAMQGQIQLRNLRTYEVERFDGVYLGTPLWVRTPPSLRDSGDTADQRYGGMTIIDIA